MPAKSEAAPEQSKIPEMANAASQSKISESPEVPAQSKISESSGTPAQSKISEPSGTSAQSKISQSPGTPAQSKIPEPPGTPARSKIPEPPGTPAQSKISQSPGTPARSKISEPPGTPARSKIPEQRKPVEDKAAEPSDSGKIAVKEKREGTGKLEDEAAKKGGTARKKPAETRPPGAPPDPWSVFASTQDQPPGRIRRGIAATGRALVHEYALATYASLVLAVVMTWPTLRYPLHTLPQDLGDPARQAWQISWAGHVVFADPVRLWQSNSYYPLVNTYAFGDSLLGYGPFALIGDGPVAAVLRYNLLFVAAHALLALGAYALVRQLGARPIGASVAAVAFAYAPWRLAQEGHLDIISAGGIPLALAMLAKGHGWSLRYGLRPKKQSAAWAAAGWLVAAWQITLGFALGIPFAYVLGLILVTLEIAGLIHRVRRPEHRPLARFLRAPKKPLIGWRLMATNTLGGAIFIGVGMVVAVPYLRVPDSPTRTQEIEFFSPRLESLFIGPAESRIWGAAHQTARASLDWAAEMSLLPGFALYALALAGLAFSVWRLRHRMMLLVAVTLTVVLTLGTNYLGGRYTYLPLFGHYPASFDQRVPGRLMLWVTLLLAILAAGAVDDFVRRAKHFAAQRIPPWPGPWLRLAMITPLILVTLEGWNQTAHPVVAEQPASMRNVTGPMLVLPTAELTDQTVQLWSTSEFQQIANGGGPFAAARQTELRSRVASFPDQASIDYLRSINVNKVLLLRDHVAGTSWERAGDVAVDLLNIRREDLNDAVVFYLR